MEDEQKHPPKIVSASDLLNTLFTHTLANDEEFDSEVVALAKAHLAGSSPQAKAGSNLANALIELAKSRATEGKE